MTDIEESIQLAEEVLIRFADETGIDIETAFTDLLTNLRHYAHANQVNFDRVLRESDHQFRTELAKSSAT